MPPSSSEWARSVAYFEGKRDRSSAALDGVLASALADVDALDAPMQRDMQPHVRAIVAAAKAGGRPPRLPRR